MHKTIALIQYLFNIFSIHIGWFIDHEKYDVTSDIMCDSYAIVQPFHHTAHRMITKTELQTELRDFMTRFAASIERLYGAGTGGGLLGHPGSSTRDLAAEDALIEESPLWRAVCDMYDYGIQGKKMEWLGNDDSLSDIYADVELFLRGLDSLSLYLEEDEVPWPTRAIRVVRTAVARHLLDGGTRYTDYEDGFFGALSLGEVALLADMDERSVRNAANLKLANPLVTESIGKRTVVSVEEARRWLVGRKGFVSTGGSAQQKETSLRIDITLPIDLASRLKFQAKASGLTVDEFIAQRLESNGGAS